MSKGTVFVAHDNERISYCKQAIANALYIKKFWQNNNVLLITDAQTINNLDKKYSRLVEKTFDKVVQIDRPQLGRFNYRKYYDGDKGINAGYYNVNRFEVYNLSPYEETLLLDTDYVICSDALDKSFGSVEPFLVNKVAKRLDGKIIENDLRLSPTGIPMYWMTAVYFKKCEYAKQIFDLLSYVKDNFFYYQKLFSFKHRLFRNDFALSIAIHLIHGMSEQDGPKPLSTPYILTSFQQDELIDLDLHQIKLLMRCPGENNWTGVKLFQRDTHILNKFSLDRRLDGYINKFI